MNTTQRPFNRLLASLGLSPGAGRKAASSNKVATIRKAALHGAVLMVPTGTTLLPVKVAVRPQARRMILRLDRASREGRLTLPRGVKRETAERFLADHVGWLTTRLAALPQCISFAPGIRLPLRGVPHEILHCQPIRGITAISQGQDGPILRVHGTSDALEGRVLRFLKAEALADFTASARKHAAKLGVSLGRISIKDTRSRWGSCAANGDLSFSWRLILAPPSVLSYLAAHEVAHRVEMNHSARYWRVVASLDPDWEAAEHWLKRHGQGLHAYGAGSSRQEEQDPS